MSDKDENFELDQSAEDLYKQLGGIDESSRIVESTSQSSLIDLLNQQTKQVDHFRVLSIF